MEAQFNIVDLFFNSAKMYPHKVAIIDNKGSVSFSELEKQVRNTAIHFINKGINKGDRVLLFVPMSIALYRNVLALFHIGATAVFLDEWVSRERLIICCKLAQCKAFIGTPKARIYAFFSSELRKIPIHLSASYSSVVYKPKINIPVYASDTALITFTTGSTGTPKAAKRTHAFLSHQFNALIELIKPTPDDIDMPLMPVVLLINLGTGCTSIIAEFKSSKPELMRADRVLNQINTHQVSRIVASPFFIKRLSQFVLENHPPTITSLKKIFTGGAPVFPTEARLYKRAFPNVLVEIVYGSTEAEPISSTNINELIIKAGKPLQSGLFVGIPHSETRVKIIEITEEEVTCSDEDELNEMTLSNETIGEIIVSGSHVLNAYFDNEKALRRNKIFVGDVCWHRTGDSGYLTDERGLYLTGRCSTVFRIGKKVIAPFMYEDYFNSQQGIEMGTVIQAEGKLLAIIELMPDAVSSEITKQIQSLEIKVDDVRFVSKIPRDPRHHSKIDYQELHRLLNH